MRKPYKVNKNLQGEIQAAVDMLVSDANIPEREKHYLRSLDLYVVSQNRGRAYLISKVLTVPTWAYNEGVEKFLYYVSHELAHHLAWYIHGDSSHSRVFMHHFTALCPKEYQHYELNYKPRTAKAAGIKRNPNGTHTNI